MKAAIYDPYFDTLGGGEKYTLSVCSHFLKKGYEVDLIFSQPINVQEIKKRFNLPIDKLNFIKLDINSLSIFSKYKLLRQYDYYFHVSDGSVPLPFAAKNYVHFQVPFNKVKVSLISKFKIKLFDGVIVNSKFTKKFIDKSYSINSTVLYPPVSIFKESKKNNIILSIGRFDAELNSKRQDILIDAFKNLSKSYKFIKLILVGGISKTGKSQLEKLKKQSNGYQVIFYPNLNYAELSKLISKSKIYWHATGFGSDITNPEYFEHFGISILEAASAGCVPVVYNGGGPKEFIIENKNGLFFSSTEELSAKTKNLLNDQNKLKSMSKKAKETAINYSLKNFYNNAEKVFV